MGKHRRAGFRGNARGGGRSELEFGLRHYLVDVIDVEQKRGGLAVARLRERHAEICANPGGIAAEDDHAVGQQDGFFDIVSHDENASRGNFLSEPQIQQFAAQVFSGENVERGERLVHEEHFRFDRQRAGESHALLHAAGKFLGIGVLETLQAHGGQGAQGLAMAFDVGGAAGEQRRLHVFEHREPGKQSEALKNDGDVGAALGHGLSVPVTSPAVGAASPESIRSSVDFPDPEGPRSAVMVSASRDRSIGAIT